MNTADFVQMMQSWNTGWTRRKFINQARKNNLSIRTQAQHNEIHYLVGHVVSGDDLSEFAREVAATSEGRNRNNATDNSSAT